MTHIATLLKANTTAFAPNQQGNLVIPLRVETVLAWGPGRVEEVAVQDLQWWMCQMHGRVVKNTTVVSSNMAMGNPFWSELKIYKWEIFQHAMFEKGFGG